RVVAGRQVVGAQGQRVLQQRPELHAVVASQAGVGRAGARVLPHEAIDDAGGELPLEVQHVVRDAQPVAGGAGVVRVLDGAAAAAVTGRLRVFLSPQARRYA